VVLSDRTTSLSGVVNDGAGRRVREYVVVVFSEDAALWKHPLDRYVSVARPDQEGQYSVNGLPPGDYLAAAVDYLESGAGVDPEILGRLRGAAESLRIAEGEQKVLNLTIQSGGL